MQQNDNFLSLNRQGVEVHVTQCLLDLCIHSFWWIYSWILVNPVSLHHRRSGRTTCMWPSYSELYLQALYFTWAWEVSVYLYRYLFYICKYINICMRAGVKSYCVVMIMLVELPATTKRSKSCVGPEDMKQVGENMWDWFPWPGLNHTDVKLSVQKSAAAPSSKCLRPQKGQRAPDGPSWFTMTTVSSLEPPIKTLHTVNCCCCGALYWPPEIFMGHLFACGWEAWWTSLTLPPGWPLTSVSHDETAYKEQEMNCKASSCETYFNIHSVFSMKLTCKYFNNVKWWEHMEV